MVHNVDSDMDIEIDAFVNETIDLQTRYNVASYLADHPQRAAKVMAQIKLTSGLQLAMGTLAQPPSSILQSAATKLTHGLYKPVRFGRLTPFVTAAAMFIGGWVMHTMYPASKTNKDEYSMSSLLEAAIDAQDAVNLRQSLIDQLGPMPNDTTQIAQKLGIKLPDLPSNWQVLGTQVVATPERPGIALIIDTPDFGEIMLLSVMRTVDGPDHPADTALRDGHALAFFEKGRTAYVLLDYKGVPAYLGIEAEELRLQLAKG